MHIVCFLFALPLFFITTAVAASGMESNSGTPDDPPRVRTVATLQQLAFMSGTWRGGDKDAVIEERWSDPEADSMMGMFRLLRGGMVVFYEFMTITREGSVPVLRIRHFGPALEAWEENDELDPYPLVELDSSRAVFESEKSGTRLRYEHDGNDILTITLEQPRDGAMHAEIFTFRRK